MIERKIENVKSKEERKKKWLKKVLTKKEKIAIIKRIEKQRNRKGINDEKEI
jgi:hypothetical protein